LLHADRTTTSVADNAITIPANCSCAPPPPVWQRLIGSQSGIRSSRRPETLLIAFQLLKHKFFQIVKA
jgi:hypothetical protein